MFCGSSKILCRYRRWSRLLRLRPALLPLLALLMAAGCSQQMANQPRVEPLESSPVFEDMMGSRQPVPGSVARGHNRSEWATYSPQFKTGRVDGEVADRLPHDIVEKPEFQLRDFLARGRERYNIFCSHCHDLIGTGRGFVPQRGFPQPPTFHSRRLRQVPIGHIFRVISDGVGKMPAHRTQIPVSDRWAIAAYVRALQFSQHADASQLPAATIEKLDAEVKAGEENQRGARP